MKQYKDALKRLIEHGQRLELAMLYESDPAAIREKLEENLGNSTDNAIANLPSFSQEYQAWYSEAMSLIKQLLPDRLNDFRSHYEKSKGRKTLTLETYRIEDYFHGLRRWDSWNNKYAVAPKHARSHFQQQLAIVRSVQRRFESSLFDIRQLVQADLFDSEIDSAKELKKSGFLRAAGVVAGVVLEKHMAQACANHSISIRKKRPTLSDYNEYLKAAKVIDTPKWRHIQLLADIRNRCAHSGDQEPSEDEIDDLINGTAKFCKTLY